MEIVASLSQGRTSLLRSVACLHTNQFRSYLNHLVYIPTEICGVYDENLKPVLCLTLCLPVAPVN